MIENIKKNITKDTIIMNFVIEDKNFILIGENHMGEKKDISNIINNIKGEVLLLLECPKEYNNKKISEIYKYYKKSEIKNESYIDLSLLYFSKKYKTLLNNNKKMKDVVKNKKVEIKCIDKRNPKYYTKNQVRTKYKKNEKEMNIIINEFKNLKQKIINMKESSIKKKLLKNVNDIIENKLKKNSNHLLQTLSEIILDYEIINIILNKSKIKQKYIIGIFGKNHVKNIKNYNL